jgi:hypothetical protein
VYDLENHLRSLIMRPSKRKKQEQSKRRFEAIKDLMSTFAMSTVAVVAVVTLIPASPKAEIIKAKALGEEIVYQVRVTDEENALDLSTLYVVLENQFDYYQQPIRLGENSGYFEGLEDGTEYRLSVYGNKGFGQERLDTLKLRTKETTGGTILSVDQEVGDYMTTYTVDLLINDPEGDYESIAFVYGYQMGHMEEEMFYQSIPVTDKRMTIELTDIYTHEAIHMYIEAFKGEEVFLLDELYVTPPFSYYASLYLQSLGDEYMDFSLYTESSLDKQSFEMYIYQNDLLIRKDSLVLKEDGYEGSSFKISNLEPNTTYDFECVATFTNPQTLRTEERIIYQEELTTLEDYSYRYELMETNDALEFTIFLEDPSEYFQFVFVEMYDVSLEYPMYLLGQSYYFTLVEGEKQVSFIINKPMVDAYKIHVGMQNDQDYTITETIYEEVVEMEEANE